MWKRATTAIVVALVALVAATASAQTTSSAGATGQQSTGTSPQTTQTTVLATPAATRPATTTTMGDTGLWFVPTGEVLPARRWSFSVYRVNFDYDEGFTDVSNWPITFGVGLGDRAECSPRSRRCAASTAMRAPSSSTRRRGGLVNEYPFVPTGVVRQPVRRHLARRQVQPHVAVRPEAGGVRRPRPDQAADGQRRRGRRRHRQDGLRLRRDRQQGNQRARRALRLRRHTFSAAAPTTVEISNGFR